MKLPKIIKDNIVLKITSLNAVVISIRLIVSVFVQRVLAIMVGEAGIANIGQVRNLMVMLTSTSTLGIFNGVVKYVSEFKERQEDLAQFFSTVFVFLIAGSVGSSLILFFGADYFSKYLFEQVLLL